MERKLIQNIKYYHYLFPICISVNPPSVFLMKENTLNIKSLTRTEIHFKDKENDVKFSRTFTINITHKDHLLIKLSVVLSACHITSITYEFKLKPYSKK